MVRQKKWGLIIFHMSIVIIIAGAGITRYFGSEGMMHIRKNASSNTFLSSDSYLKFKLTKNDQYYGFDEAVLFASLGNNNWDGSYKVGEDHIEIEVTGFIPNPDPILVDHGDEKNSLLSREKI